MLLFYSCDNDSFSHYSPTACYFNLMSPIGPLTKYMPRHELYLTPFYHDEKDTISWFALYDKKIRSDCAGSFERPVVVSGISITDAEELADIDLVEIASLQSESVEEFVWRTILEGKLWMCLSPQLGKMKPSDIRYTPARNYALRLQSKMEEDKKVGQSSSE